MANLEDFNESAQVSIEDFSVEGVNEVVANSKPSNINLAAHASAFVESPELLESTYQTIVSDLNEESQSRAAESILAQVRQKSLAEVRGQFVDFLANPDVTDEEKSFVSSEVFDIQSELYNARNLVARESLIDDSEGDSDESEIVRLSLASQIEEVNKYKRWAQSRLNSEVAKGDAGLFNAYADIFGMFTPFVEGKLSGDILDGMRNGEGWAYDESLVMLGSSKASVGDMLKKMPPEDRYEITDKLIGVINSHSKIVLPDDNDYGRVKMLRTYLEDGFFQDSDVWVDNVISLLDMTLLGGSASRLLRSGAKKVLDVQKGGSLGLSAALVTAAAQKRLSRLWTRSDVQPASISQTVKDVNPGKARALHEASAADETGEVAHALYGTSRTDAVGNDLLPEITNADGSVRAKVSTPESINNSNITPDQEVIDFVNTNGALYYWKEDKMALRAHTLNKFSEAIGSRARKEMFQVEELGDGLMIKGVYGPGAGGFSDPQQALDMMSWSLRDFDLPKGSVSLLRRVGESYVPTSVKEIEALKTIGFIQGKAGKKVRRGKGGRPTKGQRVVSIPDYLVQVETRYKFSPMDIPKLAESDVKYNIFDRMGVMAGGKAGSLQQHLLDAHSMLHPNITLGANVAVDKAAELEKQLLNIGFDFANQVKGVDKSRQPLVLKYIKDANEQGIAFNRNRLAAEGLRESEIDALDKWKEYWDTMYWLENRDMVNTLRSRGFKQFTDEANDTYLFAKPAHRNSVGATSKVFDQKTGQIKFLSKNELDTLYEKGGTLAKVRQPVQVGDDIADFVLSEEGVGKSFLRSINDSTKVLNYRDGYYAVHYKDPQFIVKVIRDGETGDILHERAVATAGSKKDAELMANRLTKADGGEYFFRGDMKRMDTQSEDYWSLQNARGRSAQRVRGKRLEEGSSLVSDPIQANILDPVDSMILSARNTSHRVELRDFLEVTKKRFLQQYEEYLPVNRFRESAFPNNIDEISYRGGRSEDPGKLGDAKTTYNYLRYLEDGYINAIDDSYKRVLKSISDAAGNSGHVMTEKAFRWMSETRGPSAMVKNLGFNMYLATNPARQLIVQGHQAVQLTANFPSWVLSKRGPGQLSVFTAKQMGITPSDLMLRASGWTKAQADEAFRQYTASGLAASVSKQNLTRGALADLADQMAGKDIKPLTLLRKVGFDAGEHFQISAAWLAHRDAAVRSGKSLSDSSVLDEIAGLSRNYTYNMNAAGDLPYNQNALAAVFQFQQVPHKALTQMMTNRVLSGKQRLRLFGFNAVMYTLPPALILSLFGDILPEEEGFTKDAIVQGMEGAVFNKLLSLSYGEGVGIDWSGLAPVDMYGTYEFLHSIFTTDLGETLASSPSGQLFFGGNPRVTDFARNAAKFVNPFDEEGESPVTFSRVAQSFAMLSSGYSNQFKARYALKYGQKISSSGSITDSSVNTMEAIGQFFGMGTTDEVQRRWVGNKIYESSVKYKEDITNWYGILKRDFLKDGITPREQEFVIRVHREAWRVFGTNPKAKSILSGLLKRDLLNGDARLYKKIIDSSGITSSQDREAMFKALPNNTPEDLKRQLEANKYIKDYEEK